MRCVTNLQNEVFLKEGRRWTTALSRIADWPGATSVGKKRESFEVCDSVLAGRNLGGRQIQAAGAAKTSSGLVRRADVRMKEEELCEVAKFRKPCADCGGPDTTQAGAPVLDTFNKKIKQPFGIPKRRGGYLDYSGTSFFLALL
jgi:hypothetical protein